MKNKRLLLMLCVALSPTLAQASEMPDAKPIEACKRIPGTPGPEDIALSRASRTLYVSSHDRRNFEKTGKLFALDLSKPTEELKVTELPTAYPASFRPHGVSLVADGGSEKLYVISHAGLEDAANTIEVFEKTPQGFAHIKTLKSPLLDGPNDLHALPDGRIFVSNDHGPGGKFSHFIDDLFRRERSRIAYFDGKEWSYLGPAVAGGNGILHSVENGREFLYRSAFFTQAVIKYELIKTADGKADLKEIQRIPTGGGPDNLEPDGQGNIHVAAHPSVFRFLLHLFSPNNVSPTRIERFSTASGAPVPVYVNRGDEISAASTGLVFENRLILSQVFEDFLLVCPLGEPPVSAK
jgi:hypothetical protein